LFNALSEKNKPKGGGFDCLKRSRSGKKGRNLLYIAAQGWGNRPIDPLRGQERKFFWWRRGGGSEIKKNEKEQEDCPQSLKKGDRQNWKKRGLAFPKNGGAGGIIESIKEDTKIEIRTGKEGKAHCCYQIGDCRGGESTER